jgi:hypothetical protein
MGGEAPSGRIGVRHRLPVPGVVAACRRCGTEEAVPDTSGSGPPGLEVSGSSSLRETTLETAMAPHRVGRKCLTPIP